MHALSPLRLALILGLLSSSTGCAGGPSPPFGVPHTIHAAGLTIPVVDPKPEDVGTIDAYMSAFYRVVETTPDGPRFYAEDRTLYVPDIKFVSIDGDSVSVWDYARYVELTEPLLRKGFKEREIHRTVRSYGNIAHVFSTYESRAGTGPLERGVNSLLLYSDGKRYRATSVMWQTEDKDHPIPPELLPAAP